MAEQGLTADLLESLEYHAPPLIFRLVGRPAKADMEPGYARLCLPYLTATTLLRGTVSLGDFTRERLDDPAVLDLAARIRVVADDNPDQAAFVPARAEAVLRDGRRLSHAVSAQFGSPEWPLSETQRRAKILACLDFAGLAGCDETFARAVADLQGSCNATATLLQAGIMG